ncbi:hypothetical protein ACVSQB_32020, partial [Bradyrhizobium elkanii]
MMIVIYCLDRPDVKVAAPPRTRKVFRKRLRELAAAVGGRHPAVLGDALLLLIEGIYATGQQSEAGLSHVTEEFEEERIVPSGAFELAA